MSKKSWLTVLLEYFFGKPEKKAPGPVPVPVPIPTPEPTPAPQPSAMPVDEIDISRAIIKDGPSDISAWPICAGLVNITVGSLIRWSYDRLVSWTDLYKGASGNNWCFMEIDGKLYGSPSDWLRPGQNYKSFGDVKIALNGTVYKPQKGQWFLFMTSTPARNGCRKTGQRSNAVKVVVS